MHSWQLSNSPTLPFHFCLVAQHSEEGAHGSPLVLFAFPPYLWGHEEMAAAFPLGAPKIWCQSSQEVVLSYTGGKSWLFPYLGSCIHISCCFQAYSAAMWGRGLWQHLWPLSSWLGTAVCSFCLQEFASALDPKHCIKTKVIVPQTAVRFCFVPPSFTTTSYLYSLWDMGISANFEPFWFVETGFTVCIFFF